MTQLLKKTQKNGDTNKSKRTNKHAEHKSRLGSYSDSCFVIVGPTWAASEGDIIRVSTVVTAPAFV